MEGKGGLEEWRKDEIESGGENEEKRRKWRLIEKKEKKRGTREWRGEEII